MTMWQMLCKSKYVILVSVTMTAIVILVGVEVFSQMGDALDSLPQGPFIVVKKETRTAYLGVFFPSTIYVFYYDNTHWVEVMEKDYTKYEVGDLYPNKYIILH